MTYTTSSPHPSTTSPAPAVTGRVSVVICAYTEDRFDDLLAGCAALGRQSRVPDEVVLVSDHNDALAARASREIPGVRVVPNTGQRGLSGARNCGVAASTGDVVLFLDDDAEPDEDWVRASATAFDDPDVVGVGGWAEPSWDAPGRPGWFPEAFLWVVGCSYEGLPAHGARIRNPIGAAMGFRRHDVLAADGFTSGIGRVGKHPVGCEETELSIRVQRQATTPSARIELRRDATVHHRVRSDRQNLRYFARRCFWEGYSKAVVAAAVGAGDALSSERSYTSRVLPASVGRGMARALRGDLAGAGQAGAVVLGFSATAAGYAYGLVARGSAVVPATPERAVTGESAHLFGEVA